MPVTVEPVGSSRDLHTFVTFPWRIYRDDSHWVPPLIGDTKKFFSPEHPFAQHGEIRPFLARRDGEVVGRIAAIRNRAHEEFQGERIGFFGFFECIDDQETADALMREVYDYHRGQGLPAVRGPMNPSTNEECGLLVEGFDSRPFVMMTHNPPYYERLLTGTGLAKSKDLLAYYLYATEIPERLVRGAELYRRRHPKVKVRHLDKKHFKREIDVFLEIYNQAWEKNWGFVPMTPAEVEHMAKELKPIVDPGFIQIAEDDGKPVAFALGLPDFNGPLQHANGRLFPFGLLKILWHARKINRMRLLALGILESHRRTGLDVLLYHSIFEYGNAKGVYTGEFSWILEDNAAMLRPLEKFGAYRHKTYRVLDGPVDAG